jgi:hypothetical protein
MALSASERRLPGAASFPRAPRFERERAANNDSTATDSSSNNNSSNHSRAFRVTVSNPSRVKLNSSFVARTPSGDSWRASPLVNRPLARPADKVGWWWCAGSACWYWMAAVACAAVLMGAAGAGAGAGSVQQTVAAGSGSGQ